MKKYIGFIIVLLYIGILFIVSLGMGFYVSFTDVEYEVIHGLWTNIIYYGTLFVLFIVLFKGLWKHQLLGFKNNLKSKLIYIGLGFGVIIASSIIVSLLYVFINVTETSDNQDYWNQIAALGAFGSFATIGISVLFAPLVEELTFRYAGFWFIQKMKLPEKVFPWVAIIVTSFVFGFIHINGDAFVQIIFYMALGGVLGFFYYKSKNILVPIIIHMGWNLLSSLITILG